MASAFITALTGLRANQSWLDVIGNNLANSNTTGFKASRALFADQFSRLLKPSTPPSGSLGGTNPMQIGQGVRLSLVDHDLAQGALSATGRTFDLALLGKGYFALDDGVQQFYTRVGSFGLDAAKNMIDLRTGYRVLDAAGSTFTVDTDQVIPPQATGQISLAGNLPAEIEGPLFEELSSSSPFASGTPAVLAGGASEPFAIPVGETWTMEIVANGAAPQEVAITSATGSVSAQDVADAINQLDHVTAVVVAGAVQITSDKNGTKSTLKVTPGAAGKDLAGLVGFSTSMVTGAESPATSATGLNDLSINLADYQVGEQIEISGTEPDGSPVAATFVYGTDGTTVGDLVSFLDAQFTGATVSFDGASQKLLITADQSGEATLSLSIADPLGQTGKMDWAKVATTVTTNGAGPDEEIATAEVFDQAGASHLVTLTFQRQDDGSWTATPTLPASEGAVLSGPVTNITFNPNGSLASPSSATIDVQFIGQPAQTVALDLGSGGGFDGITQFGSEGSLIVDDQDGYGVGELANLVVTAEGVIQGYYTNGQTLGLGNFGVATFANEAGLEMAGDNLWVRTPNSGDEVLAAGKFGKAGEVAAGNLEESNVDTAQEFVFMIQAQRAFQANARVITAQNELLEEIVNVV